MMRSTILGIALWLCLPAFAQAEHPAAHPPTDTHVETHPPRTEDGTVLISIYQFQYLPAHIQIKTGTKVRWTNNEKRQYHNVWFKQLDEEEPPYLFAGETYERVFDSAGHFPYRCGPHPEMTGAVEVID